MLRSRSVLAVPGLLLALALGACGGASGSPGPAPSSPAGSAPASSAPASASSSPTPADDAAAFCSELKANGASGSDFGAIPTFYPKDQLLDDVRGKLKAMGDATPPAEIASSWSLQKSTLTKIEDAAKKLPSGGRLSDPGLVSNPKVEKAEDTITTYWFAHCR